MATTVKVGRREFVRFAELHQALAEAYLVSSTKGGARCMYVLSLARYYDGERDGFVVVEKAAKGPELASAVALVFAL